MSVACAVAGGAAASVLLTVEEALDLAFPDAELERESLFLDRAQLAAVAERAGVDGQSGLVTRYTARRDGEVVGFAYLDTHRVRTLPETLLVVLTPAGSVARVEVLAFREPLDYLPPDGWYGQFDGAPLDGHLFLDRRIRPVTGATLTAVATTDAVRRILAVHQVIAGVEPPA